MNLGPGSLFRLICHLHENAPPSLTLIYDKALMIPMENSILIVMEKSPNVK